MKKVGSRYLQEKPWSTLVWWRCWFSGADARLTTRPSRPCTYKPHLTFALGSKSMHTKLGKVLVRAIFPSPSCHGPPDFALEKFRCSNPHKLPRFFPIPARPPASAFSLQAPAYKSFLLHAATTIAASAGIHSSSTIEGTLWRMQHGMMLTILPRSSWSQTSSL